VGEGTGGGEVRGVEKGKGVRKEGESGRREGGEMEGDIILIPDLVVEEQLMERNPLCVARAEGDQMSLAHHAQH